MIVYFCRVSWLQQGDLPTNLVSVSDSTRRGEDRSGPAHTNVGVEVVSTHVLLLLVLLALGRVPLFPGESWKLRRMRDKRSNIVQVASQTPRRPRSWNVLVKPSNLSAPSSYLFVFSDSGCGGASAVCSSTFCDPSRSDMPRLRIQRNLRYLLTSSILLRRIPEL